MSKYDSSAIRNMAFVGHGTAGKTLLCEALLKEAGLATRVPAGIMDYAQDEKERGYSIDSSIAHFSWKDKEINIIDVPGYQEFFHNIVSSLSVVETAVIVIGASEGISVNTRRAWTIAQKNGMAKAIVLTKLDNENVSFENLLAQINETFGNQCIPLVIPDTTGPQFSKVQNILNDTGAEYRDKLIEVTVETDDELLNKYLEGQEISPEIIQAQLKKAIRQGKVIPILAVSPNKEIGVKEFLEIIVEYFPSPLDAPQKEGNIPGKEAKVTFAPKEEDPFSAQVFKVYNDPFGRLVYFRVYSGSINSSSSIYLANLDKTERIGNIAQSIGKEMKNIEKAIPGDIVVLAKIDSPRLGDTFCGEKNAIAYSVPSYPVPMVGLALQPKSRGDEQKIFLSLSKLAEEDPTFNVKRDEETHELVVYGMSSLHLEIMISRLKNRFKVECTSTIPKIPYRETIVGKAESRYRHKKQSGGHGQFGEVAIKIEPADRSIDLDFVDQIVGGVVPSQFVVSTHKGIQGAMSKGIIAGYPVVGVRVMLFDGKTHEVDSSDAAFQIAGSKAFQEAFANAKPVLLEPIQNIEISVPSKYMGDIMGDLNSRRGRIMGSDSDGGYQIIKAQVPLAEIMNYSTELKSITGGEGTYSISFSHYDVVPPHVQEKIVARARDEKEKEKK